MNAAQPDRDSEVLVEAHGLSRHFGSLVAVDGVDLAVRRGEVYGFLGPNGAGKSTLFRMLLGLLTPTTGRVRVMGFELPRDADRVRSSIGYMAQRFALYDDLTVRENLEFGAQIYGLDRRRGRQRVEEQLESLQLGERQRQRAGTLSGGWKQRLALAVATVHQPRLLMLDEPTAGVDPDSRRQFWEEIFSFSEAGTTILVSTHYMDEAVRCHRLGMMIRGRRVAEGTPSGLEAALSQRVVEIQAHPLARAIAALRRHPQVASVTQLGHRVHVLLTPDAPPSHHCAQPLARSLGQDEVVVTSSQAQEPNLEDVFVALTLGETLEIGAGS